MDKVFIKGLTIQCTIGFFPWEKEIKQTLVIDVEMAWDTSKAALNDELNKTLDYAEISQAIEIFANDKIVTSEDLYISKKDHEVFQSVRNKLKLVQRHIGYGNFNVISFDTMLSISKRASNIEE